MNWAELMQIAVAVSGSRFDAEDLVQGVLTKVYMKWSQIRPEQAMVYLRRGIVNAHISTWRRARRREVLTDAIPDRSGVDWTVDADTRVVTLELIRRLPRRQRAVILLRYVSGLSPDAIATSLGIAESTVRSQTTRALATLRDNLDLGTAAASNGLTTRPLGRR